MDRDYNGMTLGVLGGMGPLATAEFLQILAEKTPASIDQEHPRMIVLSNPITPDRTQYIKGLGPSPEPFLKNGIELLKKWGAQLLAVPCNTSHYFLDRMMDTLPLPLVHIVDETTQMAKERSVRGAWLLATDGTRSTHLYEKHADEANYKYFLPTDEIQLNTTKLIDYVKAGAVERASLLIKDICDTLWTIEDIPITAACTEIPVAYKHAGLPNLKMVSSLEALAVGCINKLYK